MADLGAAREEVDITVIDEGSKGFLGMFGSKDAVVLVKKNFNPEKEAETFLKEVFLSMGLIVKIKTEQKDKHLYIDLTGDDMGILIGKRGQTLDALQYLVNLVVNKKKPLLYQRYAGYGKLSAEKKGNTGKPCLQSGEKG